MAGIADMLIGGFEAGNRLRVQRDAEQKQKGIASLFQQAYQAPVNQQRGFVSQAMGLDPQAGMQLNKGLNADNETRAHRLVGMAEAITQTPEELRPQMWAKMLPELQSFGLPVSEQYDPSIMDAAQQILAAAYGPDASDAPSGYQEFDMLARDANLSPEDRALAARRALYLDRRPSNAALKYEGIEGDDGRTRTFALDPNSPDARQIGGPTPMAGGDQFGFLSQLGAQVTSGQRTPERNAKVGGVPNSFHLSGQARDILPPRDPQQAQAILREAAANGLEVIDEGDHWHLEPRSGQQGANPFVSRRPEDEAAATAAAEERARLGLLDERGQLEAENARQKKAAELAATRESERIENAPKARAALQGAKNAGENVKRAITQALPNINVWTAGYAGQPLSKLGGSAAADLRASLDTIEANIAFDRLQQMRESSPTGGALGSVSERELTLLGAAMTSLKQSQSPEQLRGNLQFLERQYDKVLKQMQADFEADFGRGSQQEANSLRPGAVEDGYRFKGGDPADPASWEVL